MAETVDAKNTNSESEVLQPVSFDEFDVPSYDQWKAEAEKALKGGIFDQEIESLGGMAKAIDTGLPKMRIEEAAARRQARIDSVREAIVGINKYRLDKEDPLDILDVDNTAVREAQIRRLEKLRANRDEETVQSCLEKITNATESGEGNLLALALEAARARASLGEISFAVEKVTGRHKAVIRSISGVYSSEFEDDDVIKEVRQLADDFEDMEGRRPRIMIAKMGQDGHQRDVPTWGVGV